MIFTYIGKNCSLQPFGCKIMKKKFCGGVPLPTVILLQRKLTKRTKRCCSTISFVNKSG